MADEGPGTCDNKSTWPANECYKDSAVRLSPPLLLRYPTEKKREQGRQTERKKTTKRKKERKKE